MKKILPFALMFVLFVTASHAQLTTDENIWVKAQRNIQILKKQIKNKQIKKVDAINVVKVQYNDEIKTLRQQLKSELQLIGMTIDDLDN